MKKAIRKALDIIFSPFISIAVLIDESKNINEDGSWDKYWERKNRKEKKKEQKKKCSI